MFREQIADLQAQVEDRNEKIEKWTADFNTLKAAAEKAKAEMTAVRTAWIYAVI